MFITKKIFTGVFFGLLRIGYVSASDTSLQMQSLLKTGFLP